MTTLKEIEKEKQCIARCVNALALEKLKKRKAETRRKIELGGLVVKAGMSNLNKSLILGALIYASRLLDNDKNFLGLFQAIGDKAFLD